MDGQPVQLTSPHDAHDRGIRTVYQELSLVPELSVTENLLMGTLQRHRSRLGLIDWTAAHARALKCWRRSASRRSTPASRAGALSVPRQQMVEIAKALVSQPRVLILDEPIGRARRQRPGRAVRAIRRLRGQGALVIYVSHRLVEVLELATTIVVIRRTA